MAELREKLDSLKGQWQKEKEVIQRIRQLKERTEQTKFEIERAEREYDLNKAAELRYGRLYELKKQLQAEEQRLARRTGAC